MKAYEDIKLQNWFIQQVKWLTKQNGIYLFDVIGYLPNNFLAYDTSERVKPRDFIDYINDAIDFGYEAKSLNQKLFYFYFDEVNMPLYIRAKNKTEVKKMFQDALIIAQQLMA